MGIPVKLQVFEGPLDLLLHLIDKNKVNIQDIPIARITNQYMEYVRRMQTEDLDVTSEFLVMAATLLDIKARMLLPPEPVEEGEPEDPRAELVQRLLEYKMYKYMAQELQNREEAAAFTVYRGPDVPKEVLSWKEPIDVEQILEGVTLPRLLLLYQDIVRRQEKRTDPIRSRFGRLEKEEIDLKETMRFVQDYIEKVSRCTFRSILTQRKGKPYAIAAFLTLLELMKEGKTEVRQEGIFEEIYISWKKTSAASGGE